MAKNKLIATVSLELNAPASKAEVTRFVVAALNAASAKEGETKLVDLKTARVRSVDFD